MACAGNENSANYGNLVLKGFDINHQYTKSHEYELGFRDYVTRCVSPDIDVFSILRPFNDRQLAGIFAQFSKYNGSFISCNKGIAHNQWCRNCVKCAFTALALYPFLEPGEYHRIFAEDVMRQPSIRRQIIDLTSASTKPWECVGTRGECKLALSLVLERYVFPQFADKPHLSDLQGTVAGFDVRQAQLELLERTSSAHLVQKLNHALVGLGQPVIC